MWLVVERRTRTCVCRLRDTTAVGCFSTCVLNCDREDQPTVQNNSLKTDENSSYYRLIRTASTLWEECGYAAMSARQISVLADSPVSSIYHHFGSLEQLFAMSQKACQDQTSQWCNAQLEQVSSLYPEIEGFAEFFAHIVDEWTQERRPLAFAWRECELLAVRNPQFAEQARLWRVIWRDFWQQAGEIFGLGGNAFIAERLFDSESLLHLIRSRRVVDRASLSETARGIACWLAGKPAPDGPWRTKAHAQALRTSSQTIARDEAITQIMHAAAELVSEHGVVGVTHRAVADRAGLTLGAVSHRFRTKSALLDAAFEGLYAAVASSVIPPPRPDAIPTIESIADDIVATQHGLKISGGDDLFLATARDAALSELGAQLRYLRGRSSRAALQAVLGPHRPVSLVEGSLFSGFIQAQLRRHGQIEEHGERSVHDELRALVAALSA